MREEWKQMEKRLDRIEELLRQLLRQGKETDVGNEEQSLLTLKQAADFLHLSASSIYKLIYKKKLMPVQRTARSKILFTKEQLAIYLQQTQV